MKGVFAGLIVPSMVALLDNAEKLRGVGGGIGEEGSAVPLLGVSGVVGLLLFLLGSCKVSGVDIVTGCLVRESIRQIFADLGSKLTSCIYSTNFLGVNKYVRYIEKM